MLHRMVFKILDPFLACPLALLLLSPERKQLIDNLKQSLMLLINHVYSDIVLFLPY